MGREATSPQSVEPCSTERQKKNCKRNTQNCVFGYSLLGLEGQLSADGDFAPDVDAAIALALLPANRCFSACIRSVLHCDWLSVESRHALQKRVQLHSLRPLQLDRRPVLQPSLQVDHVVDAVPPRHLPQELRKLR